MKTTRHKAPRNHAPHPSHGTKRPGLIEDTIYRPLCSTSNTVVTGLVDPSVPVNCKRCLNMLAKSAA